MIAQRHPEFHLDEYLAGQIASSPTKKKARFPGTSQMDAFAALCEQVKKSFDQEWDEKGSDSDELLQMQKKAIIGYEAEVSLYKDRIRQILKQQDLSGEWFPSWYKDLVSALFAEVWGFAGVDEWLQDLESSSCKQVGERIYFLREGKMELQPQRMKRDRMRQLITALMLNEPDKRMRNGYTEVYMLNGNRITIYDSEIAKEPVIIYRKYVIQQYSFEEFARKGTIPVESIDLWKSMVKVGFNVSKVGAVRTAKTSWLITWQSHEDPTLEGIQVETDPEIPLHVIMPNAPVIQLVADGDELKQIVKSLMRSDGDYINMAEARDGVALRIAVQAANKGTRRVKNTFHSSQPEDFCYDVANEIVQSYGGDVYANTIKVAKAFHYVFHFIQLKDKSQKRLKGVYEIRYNPKTLQISMHRIMKYHFDTDSWTFAHDVGEDKKEIGMEEDPEAFRSFNEQLQHLAKQFPMQEDNTILLPYLELMRR
ncbi:Type II/IV secretion system ATP hydrolase TadA/VirB11/CpaF, TadA subfamily [Paenibacillus pasadenensis]|uniref:Type II/IV secretion system ATP hydrolase TadA/VirB11/CpaF, TadA subfamily n=1 Tax=Paenibacillus pasadenensis TaxID=217090 RepID=A0A2N5MZL0_9BACL|nr:ATPase [Paenibacillus pasadenensis]PLT43523.1 Type II/IV secretion system ATP hydrolase TadA/VirB11/CpaF, TadA subfamily [Paenibacillus pasadenensis]